MNLPPNHNYRPNYLLLNQMFGLGRGPGWTVQSWLFTEVTAKKQSPTSYKMFFTLSAARLRQIASRRVMCSCTLVVPRWMLLYKEFLFCFPIRGGRRSALILIQTHNFVSTAHALGACSVTQFQSRKEWVWVRKSSRWKYMAAGRLTEDQLEGLEAGAHFKADH